MPLVYTSTEGRDGNSLELAQMDKGAARPLLRDLDGLLLTTNGYLSRVGFVNGASSRVGTTFAGVQLQASPLVWTTAAQIPLGNWFMIILWGAGGPGSGGSSATVGAGYPGGGGCRRVLIVPRALLIALLPIAITIPLGPAGSAGTNAVNGIAATPATRSSCRGLPARAALAQPRAALDVRARRVAGRSATA